LSTAERSFAARTLDLEIYRVGRPPDPWAWPDWAYAGPGGTFGNRWDDAQGRYRVLYAASTRLGAFVETLAPLRPDASVLAAYGEMELASGEETASPGRVPVTWCRERVVTKGIATDVEGTFVNVGASSSLSILREELAARVVHYGLSDLDAATIRVTAPRGFTQEISTYVAAQRGEDGRPYGGIFYLSKLGDEFENWAIFEREEMRGQSPVLSVDREVVDPEDADFVRACEILGLEIVD
jgi:hypothetical protein